MIKLCFCFLLFSLAVGALISVGIFAVDVFRWHDKETKVKITLSKSPEEVIADIMKSEEVKENERDQRDASESGECNTPPFYGTWSEP